MYCIEKLVTCDLFEGKTAHTATVCLWLFNEEPHTHPQLFVNGNPVSCMWTLSAEDKLKKPILCLNADTFLCTLHTLCTYLQSTQILPG